MKLFFDKKSIPDISHAIAMYGGKEFQSPYRSTVASLSLLKHEQPMVSELLQDLGMSQDFDLHLEYTVPPLIGKGIPSHTDWMVIAGDSSLAIEAKWTEPRYETVGEWLKLGTNPANRSDVLAGWLGLLQKRATTTLKSGAFSDAVYQMVHRAASACAAGDNPKLAYLVFKPSPDPRTATVQDILSDLGRLWNLLGNPKGFPFYVVEMPLSLTPAFKAIESLPKGDPATAQTVIAALTGPTRLFDFGKYSVTKV